MSDRTGGPLWVSPQRLRDALPMAGAIAALEAAFAEALPAAPQRIGVTHDGAQLLLKPAAGAAGFGAKLVTIQPANPARGLPLIGGVYVLFAPDTLEPVALLDGAELTRIRTAAVSALATQHLARQDARVLLVFGSGVQARAHVEAICAVRAIEQVILVGQTPARVEEAVAELRGWDLDVRSGAPADVARADVVCTCTTASTPVFAGERLAAGAHVNAIGAYQPHTREIDAATLRRARVVVEDRQAVLAEAGDLLIPIGEGAYREQEIAGELCEVVRGLQVRRAASDVTVFKSVGVGFEDLVVARAAIEVL